ncbi:MAG: hypothetical protein AAFR59_08040, partial [Bacteroidota bacterium]
MHPFFRNVSIWLIAFLMALLKVSGQCNDNTQITTDPADPSNTENPAKENTFFDWQQPNFSLYQTIDNISTTATIPSPYNQTGNAEVAHLYLSDDYKPEDGWELLARNLGYKDDGTTVSDLSNPYIILYNRYQGLMRCFISIGQREADYKGIVFELFFNEAVTTRSTALLQSMSPIIEPTKTLNPIITRAAAVSEFIQEPRKWMMAEFELAYDPCTCTSWSVLELDVRLADTVDIVMSG